MGANHIKIHTIHKIVAVMLISLMGAIYGCNSFFMHSHEVNHVVVWHSHPFTHTNHSADAANAIAILNSAFFIDSIQHIVVEVEDLFIREIIYKLNTRIYSSDFVIKTPRAPPGIC